jgi:outer membrane protein OmpA-like peptidoglycan-associated protein
MRGALSVVAGIAAGLVMTTSAGAQTTSPTADQIYEQLHPLHAVPSALQDGHQGLPTTRGEARMLPPSAAARATIRASASTTTSESEPVAAPRRRTVAVAPVLSGCPTAAANTPEPAGKVTFHNDLITFQFGSAEISPDAVPTLQKLGEALNRDTGDQTAYVIQGHTDAVGGYTYNEDLSVQRAQAVKDYLVNQMRVPEARLKIEGRSYCQPADPNDPRGAENRRVVVINQAS